MFWTILNIFLEIYNSQNFRVIFGVSSYMKNISDSIDHGVLHDVVSGGAVFLRRSDDVNSAAGDVAADADAFALAVDDGVLCGWNEFEDSVPS